MPQDRTPISLYLVKATAGSGALGAKQLFLSLAVNAATGAVTGHAKQFQAVSPPNEIPIDDVIGWVCNVGIGEYSKLVALEGTARVTLPPPLIGTVSERFRAQFAVDDGWNGRGGWVIGNEAVEDVPIRSEE